MQQKQYEKREKWRLFYDCFHPRDKKASGEKKQAVVEFPDDQPNIPDSAIKETIKNCPKEKDNPAHWDVQRQNAVSGKDKVLRRMALSDWYWSWFKKVVEPKNIKLNKEVAKNKHRLDNILGERFGEDFSDDQVIRVKRDWPEYPEMVSLITKLGGIANTGLKMKLEAEEDLV